MTAPFEAADTRNNDGRHQPEGPCPVWGVSRGCTVNCGGGGDFGSRLLPYHVSSLHPTMFSAEAVLYHELSVPPLIEKSRLSSPAGQEVR
jgi:hypothetical protein